jgi:4-amino-4-deoxy-L-arabinose transferase-like glycosyltransferase
MTGRYQFALIALGCALAVRLAAMAIFPLTDTTEARYGEIARLMLETGNWIVPTFDYGVPFWGKPPLSIWLQASSYGLFGVNEFAGRLPSLLATLGSMALLYRFAGEFWNRQVALWALVICATSAVVYVNAGAILTDPFLAFGTTLSMVSMAMALRNPRSAWRYLFFVGLAIGLLAKGPVALVLVGGSIGLWVILKNQWRAVWRAVPWVQGLVLTAVLTLPWYLLAESRSPGFLDYFLIGEHWHRFTEAGWQGDLYGSAHKRVLGTIWLYWIGAAFPWALVALWRVLPVAMNKAGRRALAAATAESQTAYLLSWALFPMIFFSFAGNILWTYVLPALPAFAVLLAVSLAENPAKIDRFRWLMMGSALVASVGLVAFVVLAQVEPSIVRSQKYLVQAYNTYRQGTAPLVYIQDRPFSARFYTQGQARVSTLEELAAYLAKGATGSEMVAVPDYLKPAVEKMLPAPPDIRFTSQRYILYGLGPSPAPK